MEFLALYAGSVFVVGWILGAATSTRWKLDAMNAIRAIATALRVVAVAGVVSVASGCRKEASHRATSAHGLSMVPSANAARVSPLKGPCCDGLDSCLREFELVSTYTRIEDYPRLQCVEAKIQASGDAAIDPLIRFLDAPNPQTAYGAAHLLGAQGVGAKRAVPALLKRETQTPNPAFASALARIGDPRGIRPVVADMLGEGLIGEQMLDPLMEEVANTYGPPLVPELVRAIADSRTSGERVWVAHELIGAVDNPPSTAVKPLVAALAHEQARSGSRASQSHPHCTVLSLGGIAMLAAKTPRLTALVYVLEPFGKLAAPAVPLLRPLIHDRDPLTRLFARRVILNVTGDDGPDALRFLVDELSGVDWLDGTHGTRGEDEAVAALAGIVHGGRPCPRITGFALAKPPDDDGDKIDARRDATRGLGMFKTTAAIAPLIEALRYPDFEVNALAAEALGRKGGAAQAAIPELERVARTHWSPKVARAAAAALLALDGRRAVELPSLPAQLSYERGDTAWDVLVTGERIRVSQETTGRANPSSEEPRDCPFGNSFCGTRVKTLGDTRASLALVSYGEFGGSIVSVTPPTDDRVLWSEGFELRDLVDIAGTHVAIGRTGNLVRFVPPGSSGAWRAQLLAVLPGEPLAWTNRSRTLVVVVGEEPFVPPRRRSWDVGISAEQLRAWGGRHPGEPQQVTAYGIDANGDVARLPVERVRN